MEFACEMVIRASKEKLDIREFPIEYHPRGGESKLSSFRDGWRHLRFLLVHSPTLPLRHPGRGDGRASARSSRCSSCCASTSSAAPGTCTRWSRAAADAIIGVQVVSLGLCAHAYGKYFMGERDPWFDRMRARFKLEHGLLLGGVITLGGIALGGIDPRSSGSTATSAPCPRSASRSSPRP